eukprot:jgi/Botrbrau1/9235/Bobra.0028s0030.1
MASEDIQTLVVTFYTAQAASIPARLKFKVICEENEGLESEWVDTSLWPGGVWERPRKAGPPGSMYRGLIEAPRHLVPAHTWLAIGQGERPLFPSTARLPSATPKPIAGLRRKELAHIQGSEDEKARLAQRKGADRIYDYDVNNDNSIVDPRGDPDGELQRPVLAGPQCHTPAACVPAAPLSTALEAPPMPAPTGYHWMSGSEGTSTCDSCILWTVVVGGPQWPGPRKQPWWRVVSNTLAGARSMKFEMRWYGLARPLQWHSDPEFGRQLIAGANPCNIRAVDLEWLSNTGFTDEKLIGVHFRAAFGTRTPIARRRNAATTHHLVAAGKEGRLFMVDYFDHIHDHFQTKVHERYGPNSRWNEDLPDDEKDVRVLHKGRALLLLRSSGHLEPVGIELQGPETKRCVFTPNDPEEVWLLAKAIFSSLDNNNHSVISHWLRTHTILEPFIIALHRCLSVMHPLMKPHMRNTLNMNAQGRAGLTHAGRTRYELKLESIFTPGKFVMPMSSAWNLEADLIHRGMVKMKNKGAFGLKRDKVPLRDSNGRLEPVMDYPYAQDGLDIWYCIKDFFDTYLRIYYSDTEPGRKVTEDEEIMGWWREVQTLGHPDKPEGWPAVCDIASLRDVLVTVAWVASAHHAAINFSMYDFTAYMPNRSPIVRREMPQTESEIQALRANFEEEFLSFLGSPAATLAVLMSSTILTNHDDNETYLTADRHDWIRDEDAVEAHRAFAYRMQHLERVMEQRNLSNSKIRGTCTLPYTWMLPSSEPGRTGRGVPYSTSI